MIKWECSWHSVPDCLKTGIRSITKKKKICKTHGIPLISIYPEDLVSLKKLENKLAPFLKETWED